MRTNTRHTLLVASILAAFSPSLLSADDWTEKAPEKPEPRKTQRTESRNPKPDPAMLAGPSDLGSRPQARDFVGQTNQNKAYFALQQYLRELDLDAEQQEKVREIQRSFQEKLAAVRVEYAEERNALRLALHRAVEEKDEAAAKAVRARTREIESKLPTFRDLNQQINQVLTPAQQEALLARYREYRETAPNMQQRRMETMQRQMQQREQTMMQEGNKPPTPSKAPQGERAKENTKEAPQTQLKL